MSAQYTPQPLAAFIRKRFNRVTVFNDIGAAAPAVQVMTQTVIEMPDGANLTQDAGGFGFTFDFGDVFPLLDEQTAEPIAAGTTGTGAQLYNLIYSYVIWQKSKQP